MLPKLIGDLYGKTNFAKLLLSTYVECRNKTKKTQCFFCRFSVINFLFQPFFLFCIFCFTRTPSDRARQSGLDEIFRAVRDDDCLRFHCEAT